MARRSRRAPWCWPTRTGRRAWPTDADGRVARGLARAALFHVPAVAHDERLAGQRVRRERCEQRGDLGDVVERCELAVDGVLEHDLLDDVLLADAERRGLLGNLLLD